MKLRVLGAHNVESLNTRMESHLIDGVLALDAGGLTRSLTFPEQASVKAVLLTHRHFDHVRDLPMLGLALRDSQKGGVQVFGIQDTIEYVMSKVMDGSLYPDFTTFPSYNPIFNMKTVEPYEKFDVLGYSVKAVPVPHSVPAVGYEVKQGDASLFYTGDAGKGLSSAWAHVSPQYLLTEVTYGDSNEEGAIAAGHLTPNYLRETLAHFQETKGYLPQVVISHMNPFWETEIVEQLEKLARELGIEIVVSSSDMTFDI